MLPSGTHIQYLHGIGGSEIGSFERLDHVPFLEKHAKVTWVSSQIGGASLAQPYSVLRFLLRDAVFTLPAVGALAGMVVAAVKANRGRQQEAGTSALLGAACLAAAGCAYKARMGRAVAACVKHHVEVNRRLLAANPPQVLVGFSLGGAAAVALMQQGHWRGPAVLLAPAAAMLPDVAPGDISPVSMSIPRELCDRVIVIQGEMDDTVPPGKVRSWCNEHNIKHHMVKSNHCVPMGNNVLDAIREVLEKKK